VCIGSDWNGADISHYAVVLLLCCAVRRECSGVAYNSATNFEKATTKATNKKILNSAWLTYEGEWRHHQ
jgi:hypothetical protein